MSDIKDSGNTPPQIKNETGIESRRNFLKGLGLFTAGVATGAAGSGLWTEKSTTTTEAGKEKPEPTIDERAQAQKYQFTTQKPDGTESIRGYLGEETPEKEEILITSLPIQGAYSQDRVLLHSDLLLKGVFIDQVTYREKTDQNGQKLPDERDVNTWYYRIPSEEKLEEIIKKSVDDKHKAQTYRDYFKKGDFVSLMKKMREEYILEKGDYDIMGMSFKRGGKLCVVNNDGTVISTTQVYGGDFNGSDTLNDLGEKLRAQTQMKEKYALPDDPEKANQLVEKISSNIMQTRVNELERGSREK